jgi:hypothetical protein
MLEASLQDVCGCSACLHGHHETVNPTESSHNLFHSRPNDLRSIDKCSQPVHLRSQGTQTSSEHRSLLLNDNVFGKLEACIVENRCLREQERKVDKVLTPVGQGIARLARNIDYLEDLIAGIEGFGTRQDIDGLPGLYANLQSKQYAHEELSKAYTKVQSGLERKWSVQRLHVDELLTAFAERLNLEEVQDQSDDACSEDIASMFLQQARGVAEPVVQHKESPMPEHAFGESQAPRHSELISNYLSKRFQLRDAENRFDMLEKTFDRKERQRREQIAAGEEVERQTVFDHGQLEITRKRAQYLAKAEAEFRTAKAEAIANGAQVPGSDVSSGFVDNDGDRPSLEADEDGPFDRERIAHWVDSISKVPNDDQSADQGIADGVDAENWCPKDIEICDSWSARADGKYRLKIDRWREERGLDF